MSTMNVHNFYRISLLPAKTCFSCEKRHIYYCRDRAIGCLPFVKVKQTPVDVWINKFPRTNSNNIRCVSTDTGILGSVKGTRCTYHVQQLRPFSANRNLRRHENTFQPPTAQTTIDEEDVNNFNRLSSLWWDEGGDFKPLHALNELRIPLIKDALVSLKTLDQYNVTKPLDGFWILDIGSGGGILSEPLARLGASVIGLDASEESIKTAETHLNHDPKIRDKVKYIHGTVEGIAESQAGKFDAVVASEVIEHVMDANLFITCACKLVRPGGSIFFTTLNKTRLSYLLGIIAAERLLRVVPAGTHDWEKFMPPQHLQKMLEKNNFSTRLIHGMVYNPLCNHWSWTKDTSVCYALHAVSLASHGQENVSVSQDSSSTPFKEGK